MGNIALSLWQRTIDDDCPALRLDDQVLTYRELEEAIARAAGVLRELGVEPSDRVAIQIPNVMEFPILYFAALRLGAIVVLMNPLLTAREVAYQLSDSGARFMLASPASADRARVAASEAAAEFVLIERAAFARAMEASDPVADVFQCDSTQVAVIIYTSGTTGQPKGVALTHLTLGSAIETGLQLLEIGPQANAVTLITVPMFHLFGLTYLHLSVRIGGLVTLVSRFDAEKVLRTIERDRVTWFPGVPTMYTAMLNCPGAGGYDLSSLQMCVAGGAPLPVEVFHGFEKTFGVIVCEGWGLTETTSLGTFTRPQMTRKPGSIGTVIPPGEVRVVDDSDQDVPTGEIGELIIRGPFVMHGYWNRPDATAEAMRGGWFHSGDLGRVDEDGYYYIVDRKKDMILRGGYNVYPRELEALLYEHPDVFEAAVIGLPHDVLGEEVAAAVVLRPGSHVTPDGIREYMRERVAAYKYPRVVWFLDELPKGVTGKILKREIPRPDLRREQGPPSRSTRTERSTGPR
ncbi:MAG TPA: long-chain fatty acid--CoA ligase [Streptosporangiaceae bacterium]|nr:long-chain fatty acid--CoA ligase [Streptosporangiaceae bacterium]